MTIDLQATMQDGGQRDKANPSQHLGSGLVQNADRLPAEQAADLLDLASLRSLLGLLWPRLDPLP